MKRKTIYNWLTRWEDQKLKRLYNQPGRGRKPKLNQAQRKQVKIPLLSLYEKSEARMRNSPCSTFLRYSFVLLLKISSTWCLKVSHKSSLWNRKLSRFYLFKEKPKKSKSIALREINRTDSGFQLDRLFSTTGHGLRSFWFLLSMWKSLWRS